MSDRDLRRILNEVIDEIDRGRLRPVPPARRRGRLGGAVLAAALGLGLAAGGGCGGRVVGTVTDGGGLPDVAQMDPPDAAPPPDAEPLPDATPEPDAEPEPDAGTVLVLDSGVIAMYLAMSFPDAGITAIDAGDTDDADGSINAAYMAPFPEFDDEQP